MFGARGSLNRQRRAFLESENIFICASRIGLAHEKSPRRRIGAGFRRLRWGD
jgi:hypothetical protein